MAEPRYHLPLVDPTPPVDPLLPPWKQARKPDTEELATALYQLRSDADRLLDMVQRHGHLWQPDRGQMNPDVQRLVSRAVDVVAAYARQEQT